MSDAPSPVFLLDGITGELVEGHVTCGIGPEHIIDWHNAWQPALGAVKATLLREGVPREEWPQSAHWNWPHKIEEVANLLGFHSFCVTSDGLTQGMMRVDLNQEARLESQRGKPLVYVDYLEVAPWNQPFGGMPIRLKGVGKVLTASAVTLSIEEGFKGRIGLHALPQSEGFYRRLNMTDLGPDERCKNLRYFEMTEEHAQALLSAGVAR